MAFDRLADQLSAVSRWNLGGETIEGTFARFALPILWDFAERSAARVDYRQRISAQVDWVALFVDACAYCMPNVPRAARHLWKCD